VTYGSRKETQTVGHKIQGSLSPTTTEQGNQDLKKIVDSGAKNVVITGRCRLSQQGLHPGPDSGLQTASQRSRRTEIAAAKGMVKKALDASGFNLLNRVYGESIQFCNTEEETVARFKG
jgi:phosphosulfolactate synthase (CoM biosynthesis protein A)